MGLLDDVTLGQGADAAEKMQEEFTPASSFERVPWLNIKKDEKILLRFLHGHKSGPDGWISLLHHSYVPTKAAPDDATENQKKNWPSTMGAVCRRNPAIEHKFDGCYICDQMTNPDAKNRKYNPQTRIWSLAVERERVFLTEDLAREYGMSLADMLAEYEGYSEGDEIGIRDVEITVDERDDKGEPTGNKVVKPKIIVIQQAMKNFFSTLKGYGQAYGTILDRDWEITRTADGKDTDYFILPIDPIEVDGVVVSMLQPELDDEGNETGRQLRDRYLDQGPKLLEVIESQLDDRRYHKWFDERYEWVEPKDGEEEKTATSGKARPKKPLPGKKSGAAATNGSGGSTNGSAPAAAGPAPAGSGGPGKDRLSALRDRARATAAKPAAKAEETAPEPETPEEEAPAEETVVHDAEVVGAEASA